LGDKGCNSIAIRERAGAKNVWGNIPNRSYRKQHLAFRRGSIAQRNLVERFFNRIKQFDGIATRYDRFLENYLAAVKLVRTRIRFSRHESALEQQRIRG
jgi:transposase